MTPTSTRLTGITTHPMKDAGPRQWHEATSSCQRIILFMVAPSGSSRSTRRKSARLPVRPEPLSARLPCGLGVLRLPVPAGLSAGLAASLPVQETKLLRETNGLTTFCVHHGIVEVLP